MTIYQEKQLLRQQIKNLLKEQTPDQRFVLSNQITQNVLICPEYQSAKTILFYASLPSEVSTWNLIRLSYQKKKKVLLPHTNIEKVELTPIEVSYEDSMDVDGLGILSPELKEERKISLEKIDLIIVPGIAFDKKGNRIGRGKGYYDSLLKKVSPKTAVLGLAFPCQLVKKVPVDVNDVPVHKVISSEENEG